MYNLTFWLLVGVIALMIGFMFTPMFAGPSFNDGSAGVAKVRVTPLPPAR